MNLIMEIFGFCPWARYLNSEDYQQQQNNFEKLRIEVLDGREDVPQIQELSHSDANWFVSREKYHNSNVDRVLNLCAFFIKDFIGEASYQLVQSDYDKLKAQLGTKNVGKTQEGNDNLRK